MTVERLVVFEELGHVHVLPLCIFLASLAGTTSNAFPKMNGAPTLLLDPVIIPLGMLAWILLPSDITGTVAGIGARGRRPSAATASGSGLLLLFKLPMST